MQTYLALYLGSASAVARAEIPPDKIAAGMAAWGQWMADHADVIVDAGGPIGATKRTSAEGVADARNAVTGYVILRAPSHEAAARLFENHPHFTIFPGESVEIMPVLPMPAPPKG